MNNLNRNIENNSNNIIKLKEDWAKSKSEINKLTKSIKNNREPKDLLSEKISIYKSSRVRRQISIQSRMARLASIDENKDYSIQKEQGNSRMLFQSIHNTKYGDRSF